MAKRPATLSPKGAIIASVLGGLFLVGVFAFNMLSRPAPATSLRTVTINADDPASGTRIDPVNVWKNYDDRGAGVAGSVHHGDRVALIRRDGQAALIRLPSGAEGWVSAQFIAELR